MKIQCDLKIQNLNLKINCNQEKLHKSCTLGLYRPRDDGHDEELSNSTTNRNEIVLTVESKSVSAKYKLKRIETYTKFINEGKATLKLIDENIYLLLSNCPALTLINFVSFLNVKISKEKMTENKENKSNPIPNSSKAFAARLLERAECKLGPSHLKNISPLCERDLNAVVQKKGLKRPLESTLESPVLSRTTASSRPASKPKLEKQTSFSAMVQLTDEQKHILRVIKEGKNVFFTGSGGTGKSFLINLIKRCFPNDGCFVTASTGCAASLIGGLTLHAFAGFTLSDDHYKRGSDDNAATLERIVERIANSKEKLANWRRCKQLIVDEISMIDGEYFDTLEAVARSIKNSDLPFGGIQVIICGDFLQLPPVSKHGSEKKKFCFQAKSWSSCIDTVVQLTQIKRQQDVRFIEMLEEIRYGKCSEKTIGLLEKSKSRLFMDTSILPTRLCTHKIDVDVINQKELDSLSSPAEHTYKSIDEGEAKCDMKKLLNLLCPAKDELRLKVGAQVMLLKNMDVQAGLVNGSRGCVTRFDETTKAPVVRFMNGTEITIRYEQWSFKVSTATGLMVTRRQLPLQLAWAMSIHKSQGMTLDCVEISLSRVFEFGQAYVALSRAKSLDSLRISDFDANAIKANEVVIKFYESMSQRKSSSSSSNRLNFDDDDDYY